MDYTCICMPIAIYFSESWFFFQMPKWYMNNFSLLEYTDENYFVSACLLQASVVFSLVFINCFHPIFILIQLGFLCHLSGRNIICQAGGSLYFPIPSKSSLLKIGGRQTHWCDLVEVCNRWSERPQKLLSIQHWRRSGWEGTGRDRSLIRGKVLRRGCWKFSGSRVSLG